jgi:transcriptional regulator with XRE-family HTH domain
VIKNIGGDFMNNEIKMVFGNQIKHFMEARNKAQKEFAKDLGIAESTLSCYISGTRTPNFEIMYKICKALNISISDLFGKYANERTADGLSKELQELLKKAEDLTEEGQGKLLEHSELLGYKYKKNTK